VRSMRLVAEASLDNMMLRDVLTKKYTGLAAAPYLTYLHE